MTEGKRFNLENTWGNLQGIKDSYSSIPSITNIKKIVILRG